MDEARLMILRAAATEGFLWEVEQATKRVDPQHLIFAVPKDKIEYQRFVEHAQPQFPHPLPDASVIKPKSFWKSSALESGCTLSGFLYFEPDWTSHFLPLRGVPFGRGTLRKQLSSVFKVTLQPAFNQLGLAPDIPRNWGQLIIFFMLAMVTLGALFILLNLKN